MDGLLLAALSPGNQEEFVAIQIKDGRPYFLFDPQVRRLLTLLKNLTMRFHTHTHVPYLTQGFPQMSYNLSRVYLIISTT